MVIIGMAIAHYLAKWVWSRLNRTIELNFIRHAEEHEYEESRKGFYPH